MTNAFKVLSVRWHLQYILIYCDLAEMMTERGLSVVHTTIFRWVQRLPPSWIKGFILI